MTRFLRLLLIGLALLLMGAKDLPRPCIGDGQGNPCAVERCQCTIACSCKAACSPEVAEFAAARAEARAEHPLMCETTAPAATALPDVPGQAACHVAGSEAPALTHFSLPACSPPVLLSAPLGWGLAWRSSKDGHSFERAPLRSRSLCPPEPPPRISG